MKRFFTIFCLVLFSVVCFAQMTDKQIVNYVKEQNAAGKDQKTIAKELIGKGVSLEKLQNLKKKYQNVNTVSALDEDDETDVNRLRTANGETRTKKQDSRNKTDIDIPILEDEDEAEPEDFILKKKIFGHDIFRSKDLSFEPAMNIATPASYALGPGDEVILDIYGSSQYNGSFKVAPDGSITIPDEGPVNVAGLTVSQAQAKVRKAIGGHYQGSSIKLSVGQTRTILVNVLGEVKIPGTYTLSAFSTVFNALYLAGGISDIGTLRTIKVSRNGRIITTVDVYDYILNGKLTGNVMLRDNDVIIVGPYENLVEIEGNVKRPMFYEMKKNESLQSLMKFCGGFTGDAYKEKIRVERRTDEGLTVHNVDEWDFSNFKMEDGDVALVDSSLNRYKNTVEIKGAVFRPGQYKLGGAMNSVKTLIAQAGGLQEQAVRTRAVLHRMKPDRTLQTMAINLQSIMDGSTPDVVLQNEDELIISSMKDIEDKRTITIYGNVYKQGEYKYSEGETVEDLITEAGGLLESASLYNVEVARRILSADDNPNGEKMADIHNMTLSDGLVINGEAGFKLMPYDIVTIHKNPNYKEQKILYIDGEVQYTGMYIMAGKNERVSDLIKRAGGLTKNAYTKGAQLIRRYTDKEKELQKLKFDVAQTEKDSIDIANKLKEKTYTIGIDLEAAINAPGSVQDVVLQEGDSLYVPMMNNVVKISGEVLYPNTVAYNEAKSARYYINQAGGVSKSGKKSLAYIVYPNGQVSKIGKGDILPGCEIVVPQKQEKKMDTQQTALFVSIGTSIATVAAVLISALK